MFCNVCRADRPSVCESCVNEMRANHKELADAMAADACLPVRTALQEAVLRAACLWWLDRSPEDEMHAAIDRLLAAEPAWGKAR